MYYYGPLHMAKQKQDDQLEHTYNSYVRIRDVALKTCQRWWMIRRSGERGSRISVLAARHDDDEYICKNKIWRLINKNGWYATKPNLTNQVIRQPIYRFPSVVRHLADLWKLLHEEIKDFIYHFSFFGLHTHTHTHIYLYIYPLLYENKNKNFTSLVSV